MKRLTNEHVQQVEAATRRGEIDWRIGERTSLATAGLPFIRTSFVADLHLSAAADVRLEVAWTESRQAGAGHPGRPAEDEKFELLVTANRIQSGEVGTLIQTASRSLFEAAEASISGQITTLLEATLVGVRKASPYESHWMKALDVPKWRSLFHDASGSETLDESVAVRWEQWFVASETYVFVLRSAVDEPWNHTALVEVDPGGLRQVQSLAELLPFARDASPPNVHPVLLEFEELHPYQAMRAKNGVPG